MEQDKTKHPCKGCDTPTLYHSIKGCPQLGRDMAIEGCNRMCNRTKKQVWECIQDELDNPVIQARIQKERERRAVEAEWLRKHENDQKGTHLRNYRKEATLVHYSKNHTHYKLLLSDEEMVALKAAMTDWLEQVLAADEPDDPTLKRSEQLANKILKIK